MLAVLKVKLEVLDVMSEALEVVNGERCSCAGVMLYTLFCILEALEGEPRQQDAIERCGMCWIFGPSGL